MITPDDVDAAGQVTIDVQGQLVTVSRYADSSFEGRPITPGRWYDVSSGAPLESLGMVDIHPGESFAFEGFQVGRTLGRVVDSLSEGIEYLVEAQPRSADI